MARKLTAEEQRTVVKLSRVLARRLPAGERSFGSGIASYLVRRMDQVLSRDELLEALSHYEATEASLEALWTARVLKAAPGDAFAVQLPPELDGARHPGADDDGRGREQSDDTPKADGADARTDGGTRSDGDVAPCAQPEDPAACAKAPEPHDGGKPSGRPGRPRRDAHRKGEARAARALSRQAKNPFAKLSCVRKQTPELTDIRSKIIDLDPRMWINGWLLSTPAAYTRFERELKGIDAALAGSTTLGNGELSMRELSYRLFGDEKYLAPGAEGYKLLRLLGISELLRVRRQPRFELMNYIPKRHRHLKVVVSENLDPWMGMHRALFLDGRKKILGERVHGIVFGDGSHVVDEHRLPDLLDALGADDVTVLYWGDIDRAGLETLVRMVDVLPAHLRVEPFAAAYRLMLRRAMKRCPDPLDNEPTDQQQIEVQGLDIIVPYLSEAEAAYLVAVVEEARLIPQEIIAGTNL